MRAAGASAAAALRLAIPAAASTGRAAAADAHALYTLAQLETASRQGLQRLSAAAESLQADLACLQARIPLLVRSIWGQQSEAVVGALRQRRATAQRLIAQWEEAEHRLVAVANSLATLQNGQKLIAVGVPLAAAQLWPRPAYAYSAAAVEARRQPRGAGVELTLGQLSAQVARLAAALREELAIALRGLYLFCLFLPAVATAPVLLLGDAHRQRWLDLVRWTLENAGPAFIKWGQWAATRPDLFPQDACDALAALQTKAPTHAYRHTVAAVESSLGEPLHELFSEFEAQPVASGSIAQVYRAKLTERGAKLAGNRTRGGLLPLHRKRLFRAGGDVAVKVRHPGVGTLMERDFTLMRRGAQLLAALPLVGTPQVKESVMQFGAPLREQLDLVTEAAHLDAFSRNFRHWTGVSFPQPADAPLVSSEVLVETFEEGELVSTYIGTQGKHNRKLADLGLHCYLKMLLKDNFIHADLHPGNILVRLEEPVPGGLASRLLGSWAQHFKLPRLVLLDVGMIARLSTEDQHNLVGFFKGLTSMNGGELADSIMTFTEERPPNPAAFRDDMDQIFAGLDPELLRTNTPDVIATMMDTIRKHQVHLKGIVSTVVITTMVLEGWSTKLNPDIRIMDTLRDILPVAWGTRISKTLDRAFSPSSLALATL
ncbi:putative serine threonine-kinase abkC [Micractinium conductrix]|uniref:Serine threonine-kinase abkC n=1 Tax=Micractinium conductrix TaxID=554055 RepID=A0A2P6VG79_9CHLO|nr:putative serine threonine-kinase abkC [Micractinium conductrix]|eukprot:PSC73099.1 putative serine threonine-kinase abkC [Micractinium conductrix]